MVPFNGLAQDRLIPYFIHLEIFVVFVEGRLAPPTSILIYPPLPQKILGKELRKSDKWYKPFFRPANGEPVGLTGLAPIQTGLT